ncbi:hypothetical protein HN51_025597 [Arachis hypogaea]
MCGNLGPPLQSLGPTGLNRPRACSVRHAQRNSCRGRISTQFFPSTFRINEIIASTKFGQGTHAGRPHLGRCPCRPGLCLARGSLPGLRFTGLGLPRKTLASPGEYLWPRVENFLTCEIFQGEGRIEATRAESQWIVAARPLCHLQYPVAYLSRLQRILPAARSEKRFKASPQGSSALGASPTARASGGPGPLLLVGKRAAGARVASSPDSDLEAFSHNPHEISVLVELILGHLRYLLTDVPPQPNSPPDNVFRPDRPAEASLGSKKRGNVPPPIHRIIGFPLSVPVLSRLFDARGRGPEGPFPNPSPDWHATTRSRHESSSSSPPTADGFGAGTPVPSPQSQSFSRGYGSIMPTSLAYIVPSTRGCSPWRPDVVMSTTGRDRHSVLRIFKGRRGRTGHHATCGALPAAGPYLRLSRFQGGQAVKQKR